MCESDVGGIGESFTNQGRFEYYQSSESRIKRVSVGGGTPLAVNWWTASPTTSSFTFIKINTSGIAQHEYAAENIGVAPCFVVG